MDLTVKERKPNKPKLTVYLKSLRSRRIPLSFEIKKCTCATSIRVPSHISAVWCDLRNNEQLCDGVVKCEDGQEFKVHRAILAAASPFFKALFLNTLNPDQPEKTEVYVKVPGKVLNFILDYAYSGQCAITRDNAKTLLAYADQLEVLGVVQLCHQYFIDILDPYNCIEIVLFASHYFCRNLEMRGRKYIIMHFKEVLKMNPDYYNLTVTELFDILSDDELNVKKEEIVFEAVQIWVEYDAEQRMKHVPKLLTCVRLGLLASEYYTETLLNWKYIQTEKCQNILRNAKLYLASTQNEQTVCSYVLESMRRPRIPHEILFAVGGWSAGSPTSSIETYDFRAKHWVLSTNSYVTPRAYHGVCILNGLIYMIGGFNGNEHFNTVRSFNPVTRIWREHACMYYARCYVSVVALGGKIYALGGFNGQTRMSSAERYNPAANQWELIAPMQRERSDASVAVLRNKIYIVGGFNGAEVLRSVEVYDPEVNQWSYIPMMREARSGVSLQSLNDTLYVFGGFNGYTRLASGEKYSGGSEWMEAPAMLSPRSNFASAVLDNMIYVLGGFNGVTTIAEVERFDTKIQKWFHVPPMNLNRSALSACVLSGLPNARNYSFKHKHCQKCDLPDEERDQEPRRN